MTALRKDAMDLLEKVPEDRLYFLIQIMREVSEHHEADDQSVRDRAFEELERLRRKSAHLDYDKELESFREKKY